MHVGGGEAHPGVEGGGEGIAIRRIESQRVRKGIGHSILGYGVKEMVVCAEDAMYQTHLVHAHT